MHEIAHSLSEIAHAIHRVSHDPDPKLNFWAQVQADISRNRSERREWLLSKFPDTGLTLDPDAIVSAMRKLMVAANPDLENRESATITSKGSPQFIVSADRTYPPHLGGTHSRDIYGILTETTDTLDKHRDPVHYREGLIVMGSSSRLFADLLVRNHPQSHGPAVMQRIDNNFLPSTLDERSRFVAMRALDQLGLVKHDRTNL